jgi:hypothetical protein
VAVVTPLSRHKVVSICGARGDCAFQLVISKGRARYAISPAAAQLGVSCFGFLDVAAGGFERNIAQLLHHVATAFCGDAREAAAEKSQTKTWFQGNWLKELETKIFPTLRIPTDSQGTTTQYSGTRLITSIGWLTSDDIEAVLGKARPKLVDDGVKEDFLASLQSLVRLNWIVIVINGPHAPGPDVMVLALNWYMGLQCKMSTWLTSDRVGSEVAKMVLPNFEGVQHCCIVAADEVLPFDIHEDAYNDGVADWFQTKSDKAQREASKALKKDPTNPELQKRAQLTKAARKATARNTAMQKAMSLPALHFVDLGDDTDTASSRVAPFCIPVGEWLTPESIQRNSEKRPHRKP